MKKWQENPWKVCMTAKKYHVIVNNLSGSQTSYYVWGELVMINKP